MNSEWSVKVYRHYDWKRRNGVSSLFLRITCVRKVTLGVWKSVDSCDLLVFCR